MIAHARTAVETEVQSKSFTLDKAALTQVTCFGVADAVITSIASCASQRVAAAVCYCTASNSSAALLRTMLLLGCQQATLYVHRSLRIAYCNV
jgi:hypothetical protein